jgi:hypothetical protein
MFNLFQSRFGNVEFPSRGFSGLLDKAMQYHDAPPNQRAEKHSRDAFGSFKPQLEQSVTKCLGMWLSEIGLTLRSLPQFVHQFRQVFGFLAISVG